LDANAERLHQQARAGGWLRSAHGWANWRFARIERKEGLTAEVPPPLSSLATPLNPPFRSPVTTQPRARAVRAEALYRTTLHCLSWIMAGERITLPEPPLPPDLALGLLPLLGYCPLYWAPPSGGPSHLCKWSSGNIPCQPLPGGRAALARAQRTLCLVRSIPLS
jgi:hypothetical protein